MLSQRIEQNSLEYDSNEEQKEDPLSKSFSAFWEGAASIHDHFSFLSRQKSSKKRDKCIRAALKELEKKRTHWNGQFSELGRAGREVMEKVDKKLNNLSWEE